MIILYAILIYLACGITYCLWAIISERTLDMGGGWIPNWIAYLIGILFWPRWLYLYMKG